MDFKGIVQQMQSSLGTAHILVERPFFGMQLTAHCRLGL